MGIVSDHLTDDCGRGMYDRPEQPTTATYHNYIVIIGRAHGGDEDHARTYGDMTEVQARQAFINDVRRDEGITEVDVVAGYECANVYITHVLTSEAPINVESST